MEGQTETLIARGEGRSVEAERRVLRARENAADRIVHPAVWLLFTVIWLPFLFYPMRDLLAAHLSPLRLFIALAGMVTFVSIYLWLMLHDPFPDAPLTPSQIRAHVALIGTLTVIVLSLTRVYSIDWLWFIMYANMASAIKLPVRAAAPTIISLTILTVVVGRVAADWNVANRIVSPVAAVAVVMIGISQLVVTIRQLRAARQEIARLAVTDERLRFARDLHDLLGHSLSTITLKNELARHMVVADPERAVREIEEAITVARGALREVREAVSGYRQPTLVTELHSARQILEAAGVVCRCKDTAGALPPATESVLAWAVREGVTNVIRHSHARHCAIRVARDTDMVTVTVIDDGCGSASCRRTDGTDGVGNGLRGLAERAGQQNGEVQAGPCTTGGFRLRVALPVDDARIAARPTEATGEP